METFMSRQKLDHASTHLEIGKRVGGKLFITVYPLLAQASYSLAVMLEIRFKTKKKV
jgi:hypothetical protein